MVDATYELRFDDYNSPVSSEDISRLTGIISSNLSDMMKNDLDFPRDCNGSIGAPQYIYGDVLAWALSHQIKINGKEVIYRDIQLLRRGQNSTLNIAIVGKSGSRKSFAASYFFEEPGFMRQILCEEGTDYKMIPTKYVIDNSALCFQYDVSPIIKEKMPEEFKEYIGKRVMIDPNSRDFQEIRRNITDWLRELHNKEGMIDIYKNVSFSFHGRPSLMSEHIMKRTGKKKIIILDYHGDVKKGSFDRLEYIDIVLIATRREGMHDYISLIEEFSDLVETNPVIFLYGVQGSVDDEEDFIEEYKNSKNVIRTFEGEKKEASDNSIIISTTVNGLHPADHFMMFPAFNPRKSKPVEEYYTSRFEEMIVKEFHSRITPDKLIDVLRESSADIHEISGFVDDALYIPKPQPIDAASHKIAVEVFENSKHARVKSQDRNRIYDLIIKTKTDELNKVKERLGKYTVSNCKELWKQVLVTYIYQTICGKFRLFPSVGYSSQIREDSPEITMRACEYIFAEDLYSELKDYEGRTKYSSEDRKYIELTYRNILCKRIMGNGWNFAKADPYEITTLKILCESGLFKSGCRPGQEEYDLIHDCVVSGLMFQAAVDIYTTVYRAMNSYKGMDAVIEEVRDRFEKVRDS